MEIKYKIKLVELLRLRPADLNILDSIKLSERCLNALINDDKDSLYKELDAIVSNDKADDNYRLVAASLKSIILWNTTSDELDQACEDMLCEDFENEDDSLEESWENKILKEKQVDSKEQEMAFKEGKKLLMKLSKEELADRYCDYIMENLPQLKEGFDNGLYRMGMSMYHDYLGLRNKEYLLSTELSHKEYFARRLVMDGLNKRIDDIFFSKIDYWKSEYRYWLDNRHETRITKKSLKMFFDERGKHPSDKVLDRIKQEL